VFGEVLEKCIKMKQFSISEMASEEFVRLFLEQRHLSDKWVLDKGHPKEDYHIASNDPPVFVVSDGVTLNFERLIETNKKYPSPSPAGDVAEIFCKAVIEKGSEKFADASPECMEDIFRYANAEVGKYNQKTGKNDISGNPTGYYSATGAFTLVKDRQVYWLSICDAFVAYFSGDMQVKFMSSGSCSPYAVINGEERMADHIESGVFHVEKGDRLFEGSGFP
jgi:hypothetical protein